MGSEMHWQSALINQNHMDFTKSNTRSSDAAEVLTQDFLGGTCSEPAYRSDIPDGIP